MPFLQKSDALVWHEQSQCQNRDACTHRHQYLRCGDWNINEMRNKRLKSPLTWGHVLFFNHTETFWSVMTRQIQRNIRGDFPRLLMLCRYTLKPLFANSRLSGIRNIRKTNRHRQLVQYFLFPKDTHFLDGCWSVPEMCSGDFLNQINQCKFLSQLHTFLLK